MSSYISWTKKKQKKQTKIRILFSFTISTDGKCSKNGAGLPRRAYFFYIYRELNIACLTKNHIVRKRQCFQRYLKPANPQLVSGGVWRTPSLPQRRLVLNIVTLEWGDYSKRLLCMRASRDSLFVISCTVRFQLKEPSYSSSRQS